MKRVREGMRRPWERYIFPAIVLAVVWAILVGGRDLQSWIIGVPAVIAATWARDRISGGTGVRISAVGGIRLFFYFVVASFRGGMDVTRRVLRPRPDVNPGLLEYPLRIGTRPARVMFLNMVSLLPGTLSADIQADTVKIHALDHTVDAVPELVRLEEHVAAFFGLDLSHTEVSIP